MIGLLQNVKVIENVTCKSWHLQLISLHWYAEDKYHTLLFSNTVAPRYSKDSVITNNIWKPGGITVKYVETNPAITNWFWRSQRTIYPAIRIFMLSCRSQSVKTTWWYKSLNWCCVALGITVWRKVCLKSANVPNIKGNDNPFVSR